VSESEEEETSEEEVDEDEEGVETEEEEEEVQQPPPIATQSLIVDSEPEEGGSQNATKKVHMKRKKSSAKGSQPSKKVKNEESAASTSTATESLIPETKHGKKENEKKTKAGKKEAKMFNEKHIDIDLFDSDPEKIVSRKIRLNSSLLLSCRTMEATGPNGGQIEWAALLFEKRAKDGRSFDFNISLSLAIPLIQGLKEIIKANPKYFKTTTANNSEI
jgi:hypothetical protein